MKLPTRFTSVRELALLPWFELREGRLVLADRTVGPSIDCHSHLALSYVLPNRVDLAREHARTEHYLPLERPLDLDIYINKNLSPEDLHRLKRDLTIRSLTAGGMRATHTAANLAREMAELDIVHSVLLPIDYPVLSSNARTYLEVARTRRQFLSFGSVHPYSLDVEGELDVQVALGAHGIKVHPAVQLVAPDNPRAHRLYELCGHRRLPVLLHCGPVGIELKRGRELTQVKRYVEPIRRFPETTFVLGHSGALQMEEALELAQHHHNVWLEVSCQSLANVRRILDEGPSDRIVYGSDWPFYHQAIGLSKVLLATEDRKDLRRKVLYSNAARLLRLESPVLA